MLYLGNTKVVPIITVENPSVLREVDSNGVFQIPKSSNVDIVLPDSALSIGERAFYFAFYKGTGLKSFNANKVTTVTGSNAFNNAFYNCTSLQELNFPELTTLAGETSMAYCCQMCTSLTSIKFPKLKAITTSTGQFNYAFYGCTKLESVSFESLDDVKMNTTFNYAFSSCSKLKNVYFYALKSTSFGSSTSQFSNMLQGITGCTVHLPTSLSGYLGGRSFGGSSTSIVYDLPAVE